MISIIMPCKNVGKYLRRALDSLKKQKGDYEVIFCDGGSTDDTIAIAKEYGITPVSFKDSNWAEGVNIGIEKAKGDILYQFNGDDELLDDALVNIVNFYKEHPGTEWTYCPCRILFSNGFFYMGKEKDITLEKQLAGNKIPGMAVHFTPGFIKKYGNFDFKGFPFASDYDFWTRAISQGAKPVQIPVETVIYHAHGDNLGLRPEGTLECNVIKKKYAPKS